MATCAKPSVSGVNMRKCLDVVVLSDSDTRFAINLATAPVHLLSGELAFASAFPATRRLNSPDQRLVPSLATANE